MHKELLAVEKKHFLTLKNEIDEKVLQKIEDEFKIEYSCDAVGLVGINKLTLHEAYKLFEKTDKISASEREQKEFLNHLKAYEHLLEVIEKDTPMSEEVIKDIHQILLDDIMPGGLYRQVNIGLRGYHQPPDYVKVYDRMKKMMDALDFTFKGTAIEKGAFILLTVSKIHPFIDGNGRLGRLLLNYYLIKDGYIPISIKKEQKDEYFAALDQFKLEKEMTKMVLLIEKTLLNRYSQINSIIG